jgi:tripartite ATP-independent transporter DctM subunit
VEWLEIIVILFVGFIALLLTGLPVAFCFGILNTAAVLVFLHGGIDALNVIAHGTYDSISSFVYIPVPLFILMGGVAMHTGLAEMAISGLDRWVGRVPGRLAVIGTVTGAIFGAASGSSMASAATIGQGLIPEMLNRGYARWLAMGSIACSGGLAILIPPSALMVIFAGIASMPVGKLLIGGIIPGLIVALFLIAFSIVIATLKPEVAPPEKDLQKFNFRDRVASLKNFLPIGGLIVVVIGSIFSGVATPSESAALGAFGAFVIAGLYRKLTARTIKKALSSTVDVSGMALLIITTSKVFSQVLAYTGATAGLAQATVALQVGPLTILFGMNLIVFILGCLMDPVSIMLITIPIFVPICQAVGIDLLWWALIMMVNIEIGLLTPPFGLNLFVIKGVTPGQPDLAEVYKGILPFLLIELMAMTVMILFPRVVTWLPGLMG